jgi:putative flippase GtrA
MTGWQGSVLKLSCQAGSYLWVSILGTAAHFSLMALLVQRVDLNPVGASFCGAVFGATVIYWLNFHVTFRSTTPHQRALVRFAAMATAGALINMMVLTLALDGWGWPLVLSQVLATAMQFIFGFFVSRLWIY